MSRVGDEVHRTMPALTMSEKILAKASGNESVRPGQIVDGSVDLLYMHEMLAMALIPFGEIGTAKVWDPTKIVVTLDHWSPHRRRRSRRCIRRSGTSAGGRASNDSTTSGTMASCTNSSRSEATRIRGTW